MLDGGPASVGAVLVLDSDLLDAGRLTVVLLMYEGEREGTRIVTATQLAKVG